MKVLFVLFLAIAVFGTGGYFTWKLYVKPQQDLRMERQQGPPPPPPDPTLPEFAKCVELQQNARLIEARAAFSDFIERYPESTKLDDAKNRVGEINSYIVLSTYPAPEKESYIVQKNDGVTRVALKMHTTPELLYRANNLHGLFLRYGQRLTVAPGDFSLVIERTGRKVVLLNHAKFFKQYPILAESGGHPVRAAAAAPGGKKAGPTPRPQKLAGRVVERIAWSHGLRVTPFDKDKGQAYAEADHWIVISPSGNSLYTDHDTADDAQSTPPAPPAQPGQPAKPVQPAKPPGGGYALAPEAMQELAAMLSKNTPVTIE